MGLSPAGREPPHLRSHPLSSSSLNPVMGLCRIQRLGPQPQFRTSPKSHPGPRAPPWGRLRPPFNCPWSASLPAQSCSIHPFTSVVFQSIPSPQINLLFANCSVSEPVSQEHDLRHRTQAVCPCQCQAPGQPAEAQGLS